MNYNEYLLQNEGGRGRGRANIATVPIQMKAMGPPKVPVPKYKERSTPTLTSNSSSFKWKAHQNSALRTSSSSRSHTTTSNEPESKIILALSEGRGEAACEVGIAATDLAKPNLILCQISDTQSYINTLTKINLLNPSEILVPLTFVESFRGNRLVEKIKEHFPNVKITGIARSSFNKNNGLNHVTSLCLPSMNSVLLILQNRYYALTAASGLLSYTENILKVTYASQSLKVQYEESEGTTMIDITTADKLELVACAALSDNKRYSNLYSIMNHCLTRIGARTLRASILQPPSDLSEIESRLECVSELIEHSGSGPTYTLRSILIKIPNIDQLLSVATVIPDQPQDCSERQLNFLLLLNSFLEILEPLKECLKEYKHPFFGDVLETLQSSEFEEIRSLISTVIAEDAYPAKGSNGVIQRCFAIKIGINSLLDIVRKLYSERLDDMREYVKRLGEKYNLSLFLHNNNLKGYHIVMPLKSSERRTFKKSDLPKEFIQIDRLSNSFTMKTTDLISFSARVEDIMLNILKMSNVIIHNTLIEIKQHIALFYKLCEQIAKLDMLQSLAKLSGDTNYVRPKFADYMDIKHGRHPILDFLCSETPVANSIVASDYHNVHIISGSNGAGKSIFIRQIALLQVMAQVGCYLPVESATLRVADRILARISLNDNPDIGASTFVLEILEVEYFFTAMSKNTLIIIDELCRSTCVEEGTALALAVCEKLARTPAFTFFTTHFKVMALLGEMYFNIQVWQMETLIENRDGRVLLSFMYQLVPGMTALENYGIYTCMVFWPKLTMDFVMELSNVRKTHQKVLTLQQENYLPELQLKYDLESEFRLAKKTHKLTCNFIAEKLKSYEECLRQFGYDFNANAGSSSNDRPVSDGENITLESSRSKRLEISNYSGQPDIFPPPQDYENYSSQIDFSKSNPPCGDDRNHDGPKFSGNSFLAQSSMVDLNVDDITFSGNALKNNYVGSCRMKADMFSKSIVPVGSDNMDKKEAFDDLRFSQPSENGRNYDNITFSDNAYQNSYLAPYRRNMSMFSESKVPVSSGNMNKKEAFDDLHCPQMDDSNYDNITFSGNASQNIYFESCRRNMNMFPELKVPVSSSDIDRKECFDGFGLSQTSTVSRNYANITFNGNATTNNYPGSCTPSASRMPVSNVNTEKKENFDHLGSSQSSMVVHNYSNITFTGNGSCKTNTDIFAASAIPVGCVDMGKKEGFDNFRLVPSSKVDRSNMEKKESFDGFQLPQPLINITFNENMNISNQKDPYTSSSCNVGNDYFGLYDDDKKRFSQSSVSINNVRITNVIINDMSSDAPRLVDYDDFSGNSAAGELPRSNYTFPGPGDNQFGNRTSVPEPRPSRFPLKLKQHYTQDITDETENLSLKDVSENSFASIGGDAFSLPLLQNVYRTSTPLNSNTKSNSEPLCHRADESFHFLTKTPQSNTYQPVTTAKDNRPISASAIKSAPNEDNRGSSSKSSPNSIKWTQKISEQGSITLHCSSDMDPDEVQSILSEIETCKEYFTDSMEWDDTNENTAFTKGDEDLHKKCSYSADASDTTLSYSPDERVATEVKATAIDNGGYGDGHFKIERKRKKTKIPFKSSIPFVKSKILKRKKMKRNPINSEKQNKKLDEEHQSPDTQVESFPIAHNNSDDNSGKGYTKNNRDENSPTKEEKRCDVGKKIVVLQNILLNPVEEETQKEKTHFQKQPEEVTKSKPLEEKEISLVDQKRKRSTQTGKTKKKQDKGTEEKTDFQKQSEEVTKSKPLEEKEISLVGQKRKRSTQTGKTKKKQDKGTEWIESNRMKKKQEITKSEYFKEPTKNSSDSSTDDFVTACESLENTPASGNASTPKKKPKKAAKFKPPIKFSKRVIEKEFRKQDMDLMEGNYYLDQVHQVMNRPSARSLKETEFLAVLRRTDEGVTVQHISKPNKPRKTRKFMPPLKEKPVDCDVSIFGDKNSDKRNDSTDCSQKEKPGSFEECFGATIQTIKKYCVFSDESCSEFHQLHSSSSKQLNVSEELFGTSFTEKKTPNVKDITFDVKNERNKVKGNLIKSRPQLEFDESVDDELLTVQFSHDKKKKSEAKTTKTDKAQTAKNFKFDFSNMSSNQADNSRLQDHRGDEGGNETVSSKSFKFKLSPRSEKNNDNSAPTTEVTATPEGYYKSHKADIENIIGKYLKKEEK